MTKNTSNSGNTTKQSSPQPSQKRKARKVARPKTLISQKNDGRLKRVHYRPIPLSSVELDWDKYIRWTVSKQALHQDSIHINDHDYKITPIDPFQDEHYPLELKAGDRYLIIPIKGPGTVARRSVLVREEQVFDKGRLYLADAESPEGLVADDMAYYRRIYVIGDDESELEQQEPLVIGAVAADSTRAGAILPYPYNWR